MSDEVYTHGHHASVVRAHAQRTVDDSAPHLLPHLRRGMDVLDVGCGPGTITTGLAALVAGGDGEGGTVTGLDRSEEVIAQARLLAADSGVENTSFEVGNIYDLPFGDESFDVAHSHQVLHHLVDPVAAIREMRRVVRPDGLVALREADYGAMTWHPASRELSDWVRIYEAESRGNGAEPHAARHLLGWVLAAGFEVERVQTTGSVWVYGTPERRTAFGHAWAERVLESNYATQALSDGLAGKADLERIAEGWRTWAADPAAVFFMPSVEIIARVEDA